MSIPPSSQQILPLSDPDTTPSNCIFDRQGHAKEGRRKGVSRFTRDHPSALVDGNIRQPTYAS
jgi:hypothetical protein